MSGHFDSSRGSLVSSNLLCRSTFKATFVLAQSFNHILTSFPSFSIFFLFFLEWSYWELREKEGSSKPLWTELIHKLFDFNTVEEFHQCLMYQPKIS